MRQRGPLDLTAVILNAANEGRGVRKSRIMYKTFLGYAQLKEYLPALVESGLLRYDIHSRTFRTTQKGLSFLDTYNRLYETMKKNIPPSPIQQEEVEMK